MCASLVLHRQRSLQAAEVDKQRKELSLVQMEVREKEGQVAALERQCDILKMDVQEGRQEVARCVLCVCVRVHIHVYVRM